ncbi:MAG: permease-like cell division protein FtsX [Lachnospiraceae bacterium]|jgi:cell division transport system permease protein|nr:permease-like cell division protein FtsX [Lachnospiraceae bacterium]
MRLRSILYSIGQGFKSIWRNKMFSLASVATMTACIFLFGIFFSLGVNFSGMLKNVEESVAVTVFFEKGISQEQKDAIGNDIKARTEVSSYKYVSGKQAFDTVIKDFYGGNKELAESFANDNPLADSDNYQIFMKDVSSQQKLVTYLSKLQGVREVHQSEVAARTLTDFSRLISVIFGSVIIILIAVAIFLISNTITVGISVRKEEIAIMKLIGAKDSFVRAPFIVEGVVIGLSGSIIPLIILWFMYKNLIVYIASKYQFLSNLFKFVPETSVFKTLVPIALILGVGIGYIGSRFTLHRHLNV